MDESDFYAILEVAPTASPKEIEDAYERLAREYQPDPDRNPSDPARMRQINDAFDVLDDPARRAEHDRSRADAPSAVATPSSAKRTAAGKSGSVSGKTLFTLGFIVVGAGAVVAAIVLAVS